MFGDRIALGEEGFEEQKTEFEIRDKRVCQVVSFIIDRVLINPQKILEYSELCEKIVFTELKLRGIQPIEDEEVSKKSYF